MCSFIQNDDQKFIIDALAAIRRRFALIALNASYESTQKRNVPIFLPGRFFHA